jgi:hypothetical protein
MQNAPRGHLPDVPRVSKNDTVIRSQDLSQIAYRQGHKELKIFSVRFVTFVAKKDFILRLKSQFAPRRELIYLSGSSGFDVGCFYPVCILKRMRYVFLHIPFASLMKFLTCLRPRPLDRANSACGLRQCAFALWDATLGQDRCPKISPAPALSQEQGVGPLRGRAGFG